MYNKKGAKGSLIGFYLWEPHLFFVLQDLHKALSFPSGTQGRKAGGSEGLHLKNHPKIPGLGIRGTFAEIDMVLVRWDENPPDMLCLFFLLENSKGWGVFGFLCIKHPCS